MPSKRPGRERLNLLARRLPPSLEVRVVVLGPGCERPYEAAEWHDALVEVANGRVDLEFCSGARGHVRAGDILWLSGLRLRVLRNREQDPAVLVALSRKRLPQTD